MQTMQERAEMFGGQFRISSHAGHGTRIEATIPLAA
jgi:signal transduction histidine kinase